MRLCVFLLDGFWSCVCVCCAHGGTLSLATLLVKYTVLNEYINIENTLLLRLGVFIITILNLFSFPSAFNRAHCYHLYCILVFLSPLIDIKIQAKVYGKMFWKFTIQTRYPRYHEIKWSIITTKF